jgi:hypothetical protein
VLLHALLTSLNQAEYAFQPIKLKELNSLKIHLTQKHLIIKDLQKLFGMLLSLQLEQVLLEWL